MTPVARAAGLDDGERSRGRTSLSFQVVCLLIGGLVIAQAATVAVVILLPSDHAIYRTTEIAAALKGGSLASRAGRPLVRTLGAKPLERDGPGWSAFGRLHEDLVAALGARPAEVYLRVYTPPPFAGVGFGPRPPRGDAGDPGGHRGPQTSGAEAGSGFGPGPGPPDGGPANPSAWRRGSPPIRDTFVASWRRPDGRWAAVQPAPDMFISPWQRNVLLWFVGSLALIVPIGYLFARRLAAPINAFARAADSLGRDPRTPLPPLDGPAEIGVAARAFNRMQARLQRYVEDRTAMVGAISHDLRTPLSRIRFKLESAPEDLRRSMLTDVAQMEEMISSVLAFIRDAAEPARRERLDLRSLVECEVDEAAMVGGAVALEPGASLTVEADAIGVQRVVANLIGNALKYGGRAAVSLHADAGEAVIEIADEGPGLPASEMERVFRPFYRAEAARTLDTGGIGLGLAVARSIARAHGGDVRLLPGAEAAAQSTLAPAGLVAQVRLPLAP